MKLKYLYLITLISIFGFYCKNTDNVQSVKRDKVSVVFYNLENLFDTISGNSRGGEEFLPTSAKQWNSERYHKKNADLASAVADINNEQPLALMGVAEVENKQVLDDLISTTQLQALNLSVVHKESPDYRGIDVGLIYNNKIFNLIDFKNIAVNFSFAPDFNTRDILYVRGTIHTDTVHVFVNHWPSRIGGKQKTQEKRIAAAKILKTVIDDIVSKQDDAKIIVMGDMNDEPNDVSLEKVLGATISQVAEKGKLYNLMYSKFENDEGSSVYNGQWDMIDNIIVSYSLMNAPYGITVDNGGGRVFKKDRMLYHNKKYNINAPNRTYVGNKYYGGYSDHLPVYFYMNVR